MVHYSGPICDFCGFPTGEAELFTRQKGEEKETVLVDICTREDCEDGAQVDDAWNLLLKVGRKPSGTPVTLRQATTLTIAPTPATTAVEGPTAPERPAIAPSPGRPPGAVKNTTVGGFKPLSTVQGTKPREPHAGENLFAYLSSVQEEHQLRIVDLLEWLPTGTKPYYDFKKGKPFSDYFLGVIANWAGISKAAVRAMEEAYLETLKKEKVKGHQPTTGTGWTEHLKYKCLEPKEGGEGVCQQELKRGSASRHAQTVHSLPSMYHAKWEVLNVPWDKKMYECPGCDSPFARQKDLTQHQTDGTCPKDELYGDTPVEHHTHPKNPGELHSGDRAAGINSKAIKGNGQLVGVNPR